MGETTEISWADATFNPWIGCAHVSPGCYNCLAPDTLVLYRDWTWRPLHGVQVGDELLGFPEEEDPLTRKLEVSTVEKVWHTQADAVRIATSHSEIVASWDHRFLSGATPRWQRPSGMRLSHSTLRYVPHPATQAESDEAAPCLGSGIDWTRSPVMALEALGPLDLIDIQTSTGTFFANGFATHNCYAEVTSNFRGWHDWDNATPRKIMSDGYWRQPYRWDRKAAAEGRPWRVFCASLADVFDPQAPADQRQRLWEVISETPHLIWMLLTKRPNLAATFLPDDFSAEAWPNVWLGFTAEDQEHFDKRWPHIAAIDPAVRFVSYEPMLGPLRLWPRLDERTVPDERVVPDWLIWGGESGPKARPCDAEWAREVTADCRDFEIAVWGKQWGTYASNPLVVRVGRTTAEAAELDPPDHGKGGALLHGELLRELPAQAKVFA